MECDENRCEDEAIVKVYPKDPKYLMKAVSFAYFPVFFRPLIQNTDHSLQMQKESPIHILGLRTVLKCKSLIFLRDKKDKR